MQLLYSSPALKNVFCSFRLQFSYQHARRIPTCVIEPSIYNDFFVIGSGHNVTTLGFNINETPQAKFLPRYIGNKFPNLEELTAYKCSLSIIRSFYLDNMRRVQFVDFSSNQISAIERGSFKDLFSVKYLYLGSNRIETLDKDLFRVMVNLKSLDLASNRIKSLITGTFYVPGGKLAELNFLSNVCIDGNYENKDFERLEADARSCLKMDFDCVTKCYLEERYHLLYVWSKATN